MRRVKPSPALLVALVALIAATAGTAVGGVAISALNGKERKQVKKISKKQADKRITKREPKLSVKEAKSATSADTARMADEATTATSADDAGAVNGVRIAKVSFAPEGPVSNVEVFNEVGLSFRLSCDASGSIAGETDIEGRGLYRIDDGSVQQYTGDIWGTNTIENGTISWWREDGATGTGRLSVGTPPPGGAAKCVAFGYFLISEPPAP